MKRCLAPFVLVFGFVSVAFAGAPEPRVMTVAKPVKVSAADAAGPVFQGRYATKSSEGPDGPATDVVMLRSKDRRLSVGLYEAGPSESDIVAYEDDEFFFILEGAITLTSADGSVLAAKAGEGVAIPKGWKGHWSTKGYRKYYVTYETPK
jgi:uncharacterized cupin superfamily protein